MLVSDSLACSDPQVGDSVEKGSKVRTVIARNGNDISYKSENGIDDPSEYLEFIKEGEKSGK
jgi:hypothetical protein